jgi:Tfp pilus assembly protein PilO
MIARILKEKRRIVLPLAIAAVANLLAFALVVYPMSRRVAGSEERATSASVGLVAATQANRAAQATLEGRARADKQLETFYAEILPRDQAAAQHMTYLRMAQLAREANLEYSRRQFKPEREKNASLTRMDMDIALEGDYRDIRKFIHMLETSPEFAVIRKVALAPAQERNERRGAPATGPRVLTVTLTVATYYRTGDER